MNEHLLDVHITKNFEKLTVLKDVKFHVNKNEFLVIVGPTSCGKTTLANILSGIDTNYEGEVKLFGERVDQSATISPTSSRNRPASRGTP